MKKKKLKQEYDAANRHRELATKYNSKRLECAQQSRAAYQRGDGRTAKQYSNSKQRYQRLMEAENKIAAKAIFKFHNAPGKIAEHFIDLHGLFVEEAINKLRKRVTQCMIECCTELIVIVGQGHNSKDGPKLKPAVMRFAAGSKMQFREDIPNPGCIRFEFEQKNILLRLVYRVFYYLNLF